MPMTNTDISYARSEAQMAGDALHLAYFTGEATWETSARRHLAAMARHMGYTLAPIEATEAHEVAA